MFNVFTSSRINQQETEKGIYFQIDRVRSKTKTHLQQMRYYNKMAQTMITQKGQEVDTDLWKIGTNMVAMLKEAKEEKHTENWIN